MLVLQRGLHVRDFRPGLEAADDLWSDLSSALARAGAVVEANAVVPV